MKGELLSFIEERYCADDLGTSYNDYSTNPRLDDCFEGGVEQGYSKALYDIAKIIGITLEVPKDYWEED